MSLLVVSDRRTESALIAARLRLRGLPIEARPGAESPRVVVVAKRDLEPIERAIIQRVRERGGFVLQLERDGDAPIAEALAVAVPAGLDDVAGLAELAWLQSLHATRLWKVDLERMAPTRLLKALKAARDVFALEARIGGRDVRIDIERGEIRSARYGTLRDELALSAFEQAKSGSVTIRLTEATLREELLQDSKAGTPVSFVAPPRVQFQAEQTRGAQALDAHPSQAVEAIVTEVIIGERGTATSLPETVVAAAAPIASVVAPSPAPSVADLPLASESPAIDLDENPFLEQQKRARQVLLGVGALLLLAVVLAARALLTPSATPEPPPVAVVKPTPAPVAPVEEEAPYELPALSAERTLRLESALSEARALQAQKKWAEGVALFEAAIAEGPTKPQYLLTLARMYLDGSQLDPAFTYAERVSKAAPAMADAYLIMGTVLQLKDADWARTRALYERYLELAPAGAHAKDVRAILARH
jgi:tetratricopeptide (TPR) repeat protein